MTDTRKLLDRQAEWQRKRASLSWAEKVRMAEALREWIVQLSRVRQDQSKSAHQDLRGPDLTPTLR